jgi:PTS system ascorbate-specific IIC component
VARLTKMKIIYLTGHWSYFTGQFIAAVLMNYLGLVGTPSIILGGIILGLYQVVFPYIVQPYTSRLTNGGPFAIGHGASIFALFGSWLSEKIGNPEDSFEDVKVGGRWSFLKEIVITLSLSMAAMFLILALLNGKAYVETVSNGQNWVLFSIYSGLKFAASFMVLLYGVRTFMAEITPAFQGISSKLVPGAIPAFDAPVFFQYGPTSLIVGFIIISIVLPMFDMLKFVG